MEGWSLKHVSDLSMVRWVRLCWRIPSWISEWWLRCIGSNDHYQTGLISPTLILSLSENVDHMGLSTFISWGVVWDVLIELLTPISCIVLTKCWRNLEKRLDAIKGFTELGSGFKIAMRDLSIRGARGASQLVYHRLSRVQKCTATLGREAINKRQVKTQVRRKGNAEFNLQIDAYLPYDYISDEHKNWNL